MKKAIVIGGGNGMGLAISLDLIGKGYKVNILDIKAPEEGVLPEGSYSYEYINLIYLDEERLAELAEDEDLEVLMITAGRQGFLCGCHGIDLGLDVLADGCGVLFVQGGCLQADRECQH